MTTPTDPKALAEAGANFNCNDHGDEMGALDAAEKLLKELARALLALDEENRKLTTANRRLHGQGFDAAAKHRDAIDDWAMKLADANAENQRLIRAALEESIVSHTRKAKIEAREWGDPKPEECVCLCDGCKAARKALGRKP